MKPSCRESCENWLSCVLQNTNFYWTQKQKARFLPRVRANVSYERGILGNDFIPKTVIISSSINSNWCWRIMLINHILSCVPVVAFSWIHLTYVSNLSKIVVHLTLLFRKRNLCCLIIYGKGFLQMFSFMLFGRQPFHKIIFMQPSYKFFIL